MNFLISFFNAYFFLKVFAQNLRAPDSLPPRAKMVYAGTKGAFTNAMSGISVKIEANDLSDITRDVIIDKCKKI